jgi:hypothetical protein
MSILLSASILLSLTGGSQSSPAGNVHTDALSRCLVEQSSEADKTMIVRWVFAAIATSPEVREMSRVTEAERTTLHQSMASLFERLVTRDCRAKTVAAVIENGEDAIGTSFSVLGEIAMQSLASQPSVNAQFEKIGEFVNETAIDSVRKEAGIATAEE